MKNVLFILMLGISLGCSTSSLAQVRKSTKTKLVHKPNTLVAVKKDTAIKHHHLAHHHKKHTSVVTENEETIELEGHDQKMVVEVKNGGMYVNGDLVSTIGNAKKEDHKVVINLRDDVPNNSADEHEKRVARSAGYEDEYYYKAMLGVYTETVGGDGAKVLTVMRNSPADEAGIMPGDIITYINKRAVHNPTDLIDAIGDHNGGEKISVTYYRRDAKVIADAVLVDMVAHRRHDTYEYEVPDLHGDLKIHAPFNHTYMFNYVDGSLEYTPRLGVKAKSASNGRGVVLLEVKPNSPAEEAGLQNGDIITRMDHLRTATVDDIQDILDDAWPNQRIEVQFKRAGVLMFAHLKFGKEKLRKDL